MNPKNSISNKGYIILKNALNKNLIKEIKNKILKSKNKKNSYDIFSKKIAKVQNQNLFKYINPINKILSNENIIDKLLFEKKVIFELKKLLGSDLAFSEGSSLFINKPNKEKNYFFKDWHQEIWSGADTSSVIMWTSVFQPNTQSQIEIIKSSHTWGHIPHRNRKPLNLPKSFQTLKTNLKYTDVILMHSMLMHRSSEITSDKFLPRLATPCMIRNFKFQNNSFENNKTWKRFSYSDFTQIERILGNDSLSPYRLMDLDQNYLSKGTL